MYDCDYDRSILILSVAPTVMVLTNDECQHNGRTITLECRVTANPSAVVVWKRGHSNLKNSYKYKIKSNKMAKNVFLVTLEIRSLDQTDSGMYTCTGHNDQGTSNDTLILRGELSIYKSHHKGVLFTVAGGWG